MIRCSIAGHGAKFQTALSAVQSFGRFLPVTVHFRRGRRYECE